MGEGCGRYAGGGREGEAVVGTVVCVHCHYCQEL